MFIKHSEVFGWKLLCKCKIIISSQPPVPWLLTWLLLFLNGSRLWAVQLALSGTQASTYTFTDFFFSLCKKHSNSVGCLEAFQCLNFSLLVSTKYCNLQASIVNRLLWKKSEGESGQFEEMAPLIKNKTIHPSHAESKWTTKWGLSPLPRGILYAFMHRKEKRIEDLLSVPKFRLLPSP